jgi:acetone carboxylase gamma subunit
MGRLNEFFCPSCAYLVQVSGGPDRGFLVATVTISCATCRKLVDVDLPGPIYDDMLMPVPDVPAPPPPCPSARTIEHVVTEWRAPGPCPRCRETLFGTGRRWLWD